MNERQIRSIVVRPNHAGAGHFVVLSLDDGEEVAVGGVGVGRGFPIFDYALVMSTVTLYTMKMLLGHGV